MLYMENTTTYNIKKWSNTNINELLENIINDIKIDDDEFTVKSELNQNIWDGDSLNHGVKKILLKNSIEFLKFSNLDKFKINDIIITGSIANYNWNDNSDIDLHILMNTEDIGENDNIITDYLKLLKNNWNELINPKIDNHDIEVYVQDIKEPHKSTGVYSIINDKWLKKPIKKMVSIDVEIIEKKANDIIGIIEDLISNNNEKNKPKLLKIIVDKLKKYRSIGLNRDGEFSTENLVFKALRYGGVISELIDQKNLILNKELSD